MLHWVPLTTISVHGMCVVVVVDDIVEVVEKMSTENVCIEDPINRPCQPSPAGVSQTRSL